MYDFRSIFFIFPLLTLDNKVTDVFVTKVLNSNDVDIWAVQIITTKTNGNGMQMSSTEYKLVYKRMRGRSIVKEVDYPIVETCGN